MEYVYYYLGKSIEDCTREELIEAIKETASRIRHMEERMPFVDYKKMLFA